MIDPTRALVLWCVCGSFGSWASAPDELKCETGRARIESEKYALAQPLLEKACEHGTAPAE